MVEESIHNVTPHGLQDPSSALGSGATHRFADWPPTPDSLPIGRPGVYSIWEGRNLIYIGMAWRDAQITMGALGVFGRLRSHASGRRSGDQFNIYICDHYVIPELGPAEMDRLRNGERLLDSLTKKYISEHLTYRVWLAPDGATARAVEHSLRGEGLAGQLPRLNPRRNTHAF